MKRKLQEALLAFVLERSATKQEILEMYLNEVYLGQSGSFGINGVGEAARIYFGKDVTNLTLTESALLAGMIQSPNPYNPFRHEARATERATRCCARCRTRASSTRPRWSRRSRQPLLVERPSLDSTDAPYFVDLVGQQLARALRGEGPERRATCRSTRRSTCTCSRSRSRRCCAGSTASRR